MTTIIKDRLKALDSIPLLREQLIDWLARRATAYLAWVHERECARAPICPDCEQPEPDCWCAQKQHEQAIIRSEYAMGYERALGVLEEN